MYNDNVPTMTDEVTFLNISLLTVKKKSQFNYVEQFCWGGGGGNLGIYTLRK